MSETPPLGSRGPDSSDYHAPVVWIVACCLGVTLVAWFVEGDIPRLLVSIRLIGTIVGELMAITCLVLATIRAFEGSPRSLASLPSLGVVLVGAIALATQAVFTVITFGVLVATMLILRRLRPLSAEEREPVA